MAEQFTLQEWMATQSTEFQVSQEVLDQIEEITTTLHNLFESHNIPYVMGYVHGSTEESFNVCTNALLVPVDRVPAELLTMFTASIHGNAQALDLIFQVMSNQE